MTYPKPEVVSALSRFVPLKVESAKNPELARGLSVRWLPGLAVVDEALRPLATQVGFLPPEDLLPELDFALALAAMGAKRYDEAHALFQAVADRREAYRAPEAAYWWGVSRLRQQKEFASTQGPWSLLLERWPQSQWARKVAYAQKHWSR